jgi:tellurite resistance protein
MIQYTNQKRRRPFPVHGKIDGMLFYSSLIANTMTMEQTENILEGYTDQEKGAYLGAIASIAAVDRAATQDELQHLTALAEAAELSPAQEASVVRAATELSHDEFQKCLDILKNSDLKYSLVADIITFAKVDGNYTDEEKKNIEKISAYLDVNEKQFTLLDQFVNKTTQSSKDSEEVRKPGFFDALGMKNPLENAGINVNSMSRGLLGMLGPVVLAGVVGKALRHRPGYASSVNRNRLPIPGRGVGGLGSIFSLLNQGGSYRGMRGMLPGLFR